MKAITGQRHTKSTVIIITVMSIVCLIFMMPYIWMLLNSFKTRVEIIRGGTFLPKVFTFENYVTVFTKAPIQSWFVNSVTIAVSVTLTVLFTSSLAGYVFAKYNFKGKQIIFWTLMATMMVPQQTTMIPSFLIITGLGMYDSILALILPGIVASFGIFLCKQFIEDIPDSLCEAARIDGAGNMSIYVRIIIPLIKPALSALAIFIFLAKWNDYLGPLLYLSDPRKMTLPLALSFFSSQRSSDTGAVMAAATVVMLPVTVVFLCFQKQFIKGIAITGMK